MRIRTLIAGGLLALVALGALPQAAFAADPGTTAGNDLVVCVQKARKDNQASIANKQYSCFTYAIDNCRKATSLFTPARSELIWGTLAFLIVAAFLIKYAFPALKKGLRARTEKIRADLEAADRARGEAEGERRGHESQLHDARAEATRIVEAARQDAERSRQQLIGAA